MTVPAFFDGHNDVLLRIALSPDLSAAIDRFITGETSGHLDLPRARAGGFAGGLFALFAPPPVRQPGAAPTFSDPVAIEAARADMFRQIAVLYRLQRQSGASIQVCRTVPEIGSAMADGRLAAMLHMEGAEAIDPDLEALEVFYAAGLRSLGPVWSRPNIFATGVPLRFGVGPDIGPGLTDAGKALIKACNALGIMIDLSHLNEKGFWDVAEISDAPLVATHSNAFALANHARNLTERQLHAIRDSNGLVGVNFGVTMLRPDGQRSGDVPLETIVRHVDHLIGELGVERVAFGSDFDGTQIPTEIADASGLPRLVNAFRSHGYDDETLQRICCKNWLDVLQRTID